jgi:hypothetical protein
MNESEWKLESKNNEWITNESEGEREEIIDSVNELITNERRSEGE